MKHPTYTRAEIVALFFDAAMLAAFDAQFGVHSTYATDAVDDYFLAEMARLCRRTTPDLQSEHAQAEREIASLLHDDDPAPGAFYGHTDTEPETEPAHA